MRGKYWYLLGTLFLTGCLVRTYTIEKPRQDLELTGNQGYLVGEPKEKTEITKKMRKITVIEFEFGAHNPLENEEKKNKKQEEEATSPDQESLLLEEENISETEGGKSIIEEKKDEKIKFYTVQKGDTLQKISFKFYGTTKKWPLLYERNKNTLKSKDRIYPGERIVIPLE